MAEPMSAERLAEIRERVAYSTERSLDVTINILVSVDVPDLLAEVDRLRALWAAVAKDSRDRKAEADGRRQHAERLKAEVEQLRADREVLYRYSLGVNAFARSLMEKPEAVIDHLTKHTDAKAMIVAQKGQLDVSEMLAAGWVLDDRVDYVAGKRIRFLRPPAPGTYEMDGGDQS